MSEWQIKDSDESITAEAPELLLEVSNTGLGEIRQLAWQKKLKYLQFLKMYPILRGGRYYDIYKLNCLFEQLIVESQNSEASTENDILKINVSSGTRDLSLRQEIMVDIEKASIDFHLSVGKNGPGRDRLQLIYVTELPNLDHGVALITPAKGKLVYHRAYEPSGQEMHDQDHHTFFPRVERLDSNYLLLASGEDGKSVKYSGENLRYSDFAIWPKNMILESYGNDFWLEQSESYSERFSIQLVDGVGGINTNHDDVNGIGAILERKYITTQDSPKVYFSSPDNNHQTKAMILKVDEEQISVNGTGNLELDVNSLPDGNYAVVKEIVHNGQQYSSQEEMVLLKNRYQKYEEKSRAIHKFADDCENGKQLEGQTQIRIDLIKYILDEIDVYMEFSDTEQVDALFRDAERLVEAVNQKEPADLPKRGEILYQNDFSKNTNDFDFYGNGEISYSQEKGMYIAPIITIDAWSKFKTEGSFMVEFDYYVMQGRGGTMLQLCCTHPNPVNDYSLMCSANSNMSYYNFGTSCYHYSFNRGDNTRTDRICNLRKTGKGFYVLSKIKDPFINIVDTWRHLTFVKDENHMLFFVNDQLVQEYFDEGNRGPVLGEGHIGLRNWSKRKSAFKNMVISRIK